jgi:hypothetical protein
MAKWFTKPLPKHLIYKVFRIIQNQFFKQAPSEFISFGACFVIKEGLLRKVLM